MSYERLAVVPYAYAAAVPSGSRLLFTAGACPLDQDGSVIGSGDHAVQAERATDNLLAVLTANGAGAEHLIQARMYVVGSREDLVKAWEVAARRLSPHRPPSTLLGVSVLGYRDQPVEIEGVAVLPD
jgi:enamine deaminase RidA (YjgF/YER057c/UK114 family)